MESPPVDGPSQAWPALTATSDVSLEAIEALTRSEEKLTAYRVDPYFRHGMRHVVVDAVLSTTFVILKPDSIAGRRADTVVEYLFDAGFAVLDGWAFTFTPSLIRELWRYQYNVASWHRVDVVDILLPSGESLLLLLHDTRWEQRGLPAACRLAAMKGSADPEKRKPNDLRTILDAPTPQFNFVHTADEPADVVRELAAIEIAHQKRILHDGASKTLDKGAVYDLVYQLYERVAAHDLDCDESWARLTLCADEAVKIIARQAVHDNTASWADLIALFPDGKPPGYLLWDVLSIATAELPHSLPDARPVIPTLGADVRAWTGPNVPK
jgi:nucleoside diphosphate kinase